MRAYLERKLQTQENQMLSNVDPRTFSLGSRLGGKRLRGDRLQANVLTSVQAKEQSEKCIVTIKIRYLS